MNHIDEKCFNCTRVEEEKMDILFKIMDNENDVTLADENGIILRVSDSYEQHYLVPKEEVIGKPVAAMEEQGIFNPSVTALVLRKNEKQRLCKKISLARGSLQQECLSLKKTEKYNMW